MPLDAGGAADRNFDAGDDRAMDIVVSAPTLQSGASIGEALKALREYRGLSVEDVADRTRVRRAYLSAIETMRLDQLPSRPFTIGYIRAYAVALGVDAEAAVARFKAEEPVSDQTLRAPVGVLKESDPRFAIIAMIALVIVAAIIMWNVAQRAMTAAAPPPPTAPQAAANRAMTPKAGPVALGAPLPPPTESTTPALYETPGLAAATEDGLSNHGAPVPMGQKSPGAALVDVSKLPLTFTPKGEVYGQPSGQPSLVTLQALKATSLIVRGATGQVYFARQLTAGEAYRAPQLAGLMLEVSEPDAIQVFLAGQSKGLLPSAQVALGKLQN